jgi:anaerobic ribonucleoside-triphosphate reductase activating protein
MEWLATRKGLLDAVAFCGGEPTVHKSLLLAMRQVRTLGFKVALHTSGLYPYNFANMLPFLDWVGFDVKAPFARYLDVTRVPGSGCKVKESLERMLFSKVAYEIRTTVHNAILNSADLVTMARDLQNIGVSRWVLQRFNKAGCADLELVASYAPIDDDLVDRLRVYVPNILVR